MCPACIATMALIAGIATTTGGLTALVVTKLGAGRTPNQIPSEIESKENHHGHQPDEITTP